MPAFASANCTSQYNLRRIRAEPSHNKDHFVLQILSITTPIFILIGLGFFSARIGLVSREQIRGMGTFVINLALPALVLKALLENPIGEFLNWQYLTAYGLGSLAVFGLGLFVSLRLRREPLDSSAITALGMANSNSGFVGYPVVAMALGAPAAIGMALNMIVENLLIIPLALALAEAGQQRGSTRTILLETLKRLGKSPLIIAMLIGMVLALFELRLPAIPAKVVEMLATASAPVALFVIGGSLFGLKLNGLYGEIGMIALGKLVLHPLAVFLIFWSLPGVDPILMLTGVLFASAPMLSIYPIFGQRFGLDGRCAAALLFTTVISFVTISSLLGLIAPRL